MAAIAAVTSCMSAEEANIQIFEQDTMLYTVAAYPVSEHVTYLRGEVLASSLRERDTLETGFLLSNRADMSGAREILSTGEDPVWQQVCAEGLEEATVYYYQIFARYKDRMKYGEVASFKTLTFQPAGTVDLGLPSGTLWADANLGAENTEDFGAYYRWAETEPYPGDDAEGYQWGHFDLSHPEEPEWQVMTKYNNADGKYVMDPEDDPVQVKLGGGWRTPSLQQMEELLDPANCSWEWTYVNNIPCVRFTSLHNGNSLSLPIYYSNALISLEVEPYIWYYANSRHEEEPCLAHGLSGGHYMGKGDLDTRPLKMRYSRCPIRPVK